MIIFCVVGDWSVPPSLLSVFSTRELAKKEVARLNGTHLVSIEAHEVDTPSYLT